MDHGPDERYDPTKDYGLDADTHSLGGVCQCGETHSEPDAQPDAEVGRDCDEAGCLLQGIAHTHALQQQNGEPFCAECAQPLLVQQPAAKATAGCLCTACPWPGLKFENADLQAEVEALTVRISHLHDAAALYARVEDENAALRARLAVAETREKTLAQWPTVFRDHFGPEGDDLMIADKGVEDLVAERNMAQSDKEAAERERDALREALSKVVDPEPGCYSSSEEFFCEVHETKPGPCAVAEARKLVAPKEATS